METMYIILIVLATLITFVLISIPLYKLFFKRVYDIVISGIVMLILSPILIILTILGAIAMKGNPFFLQERPGKNGKIFKLIKVRTMTCEKDRDGILLPDESRLIK